MWTGKLKLSPTEGFKVIQLMNDCRLSDYPSTNPFDTRRFMTRLRAIVGAKNAARFDGAGEFRITQYTDGRIVLVGFPAIPPGPIFAPCEDERPRGQG